MADMRKVVFCPVDSDDYPGWINFDNVAYVEDHGKRDGVHVAIAVMMPGDASSQFNRIRVSKTWQERDQRHVKQTKNVTRRA